MMTRFENRSGALNWPSSLGQAIAANEPLSGPNGIHLIFAAALAASAGTMMVKGVSMQSRLPATALPVPAFRQPLSNLSVRYRLAPFLAVATDASNSSSTSLGHSSKAATARAGGTIDNAGAIAPGSSRIAPAKSPVVPVEREPAAATTTAMARKKVGGGAGLPDLALAQRSNMALPVPDHGIAPSMIARTGAANGVPAAAILDTTADPAQPPASSASASIIADSDVLRGDDDGLSATGQAGSEPGQSVTRSVSVGPALDAPSATSAQMRRIADGVELDVKTAINGKSAGSITLTILSPNEANDEYVSNEIYLKVSDLVNLLSDRMSPELLKEISASPHVADFITLNDLRAQGISASFDHHDRLVLKAKPAA